MNTPETIPLISLNISNGTQSPRALHQSGCGNDLLPLHNTDLYKDEAFKNKVQKIVNDTPDAVNSKDDTGRNVIHFLIENGINI